MSPRQAAVRRTRSKLPSTTRPESAPPLSPAETLDSLCSGSGRFVAALGPWRWVLSLPRLHRPHLRREKSQTGRVKVERGPLPPRSPCQREGASHRAAFSGSSSRWPVARLDSVLPIGQGWRRAIPPRAPGAVGPCLWPLCPSWPPSSILTRLDSFCVGSRCTSRSALPLERSAGWAGGSATRPAER